MGLKGHVASWDCIFDGLTFSMQFTWGQGRHRLGSLRFWKNLSSRFISAGDGIHRRHDGQDFECSMARVRHDSQYRAEQDPQWEGLSMTS